MTRSFLIAAAALALAGCATTTNQPGGEIRTLAAAEQAATLVTQAADTYVNTANPGAGARAEIRRLSNTVHAALVDLETARRAGGPLSFDAFNAALQAMQAYESANMGAPAK